MKDTILSREISNKELYQRNSLFFWLNKKIITEIIRFSLVLLFVYAGASKLQDYQTFVFQLGRSPFIDEFAQLTAWALPAGEILVGLALTLNRFRLLGLYASLFLMTMFSAYIYAMVHYSFDLPCSCGGILSNMDWETHLWFNLVFVVLSLGGILLETGNLAQSE